MLIEHDRQVAALLVDELLGQQQVVIKSLEANFTKVSGIAGATILGDGRVAPDPRRRRIDRRSPTRTAGLPRRRLTKE